MQFSSALVHLLSIVVALDRDRGGPATGSSRTSSNPYGSTVPKETYDDLVFYLQYASSTWNDKCVKPNGNTLVSQFLNEATDIHGFIARDDIKNEVVVAFRGSDLNNKTDMGIVFNTTLVPFSSPGVHAPDDIGVHGGFLKAWNSVAEFVISEVRSQLVENPGYSIVMSGHSLGGSLSSIGGTALKYIFNTTNTRIFTYGQPRTGNSVYARFVQEIVGIENIFRATQSLDLVPFVFSGNNYTHHATEYFQYLDPPSAETTKKCSDAIGDDMDCSASVPVDKKNMQAHEHYFNLHVGYKTWCT